MPPGDILAFGPFQFDTRTKRLSRDGEPVVISARQIDPLYLLVSKAGQILSKDVLIEADWLLGLIHLARGDESSALEEFERELSYEGSGHLYARECCANT